MTLVEGRKLKNQRLYLEKRISKFKLLKMKLWLSEDGILGVIKCVGG